MRSSLAAVSIVIGIIVGNPVTVAMQSSGDDKKVNRDPDAALPF